MARREGQTAEQEAEAISALSDGLRGVIKRIGLELGDEPVFAEAIALIGQARSKLISHIENSHG